LHMQQPRHSQREQEQLKEANEHEVNEVTRSWATLDALDEEFDYFDRQHDVVPSSSLGLGLGLDNAFGYSLGTDLGDAMAYPALNSFGDPFSLTSSLPSASSASSPFSRHRAMSPSATSSSGATTATSSFNRQVEVSVSTSPSSLSKQQDGVSFDLKLANNSVEDDDMSSTGTATSSGADKTVTVLVRKVPPVSSSSSGSKKTILLELTTSSASSGPNGSSDDLEALNADFEALLGNGLAVPAAGELGDDAALSHAQWRLALAPRDAI